MATPRLRKTEPAKAKNATSKAAGNSDTLDKKPETFFPLARYISVAGVHVSLLAFTAAYLPRTTLSSLASSQPQQPSSTDETTVANFVRLIAENPRRTLAWLCLGTLVLQTWWAGWIRHWALEDRVIPGPKSGKDGAAQLSKHKLEREARNSFRVKATKDAVIATLAASVAFHLVIVLFGAPIASHLLHTYLLGLLIAILTVWTPAYTFGLPSLGSSTEAFVIRLAWIRLFAEVAPRTPIERAIAIPAVGTMLGCWSGAIPIGLDWERPWQAWPLTSAYGALGGYILGSFVAVLVSSVQDVLQDPSFRTSQGERPVEKGKEDKAKPANAGKKGR